MSSIYLLRCKSSTRECYYSTKGIYIVNIPFEEFETVEIQKLDIVRNRRIPAGCIKYDLMPVFRRFQRAWRQRSAWFRSPRWILERQATGKAVRPPPLFFQKDLPE
jgi:hypothetical protein